MEKEKKKKMSGHKELNQEGAWASEKTVQGWAIWMEMTNDSWGRPRVVAPLWDLQQVRPAREIQRQCPVLRHH